MTLLINIIGAGNVGQTLGHLWVKHQLAQIGGLCNQTPQSTLNAIRFIGQGTSYSGIADLPHANITLITTPDDRIAHVSTALYANKTIQAGDIIMHCSGTLSSESLLAIKSKGCFIASVHPMHSFRQPALSVNAFMGTYCAIEGDAQALGPLHTLFESIGAIVHVINKDKKALYHAAAVFASNYLITLSHQARNCLQEAGVQDDVAIPLIVNLMQSSLNNLASTRSPKLALTGPIQRGDDSTVDAHLAAFTIKEQQALYSILAEATRFLSQ